MTRCSHGQHSPRTLAALAGLVGVLMALCGGLFAPAAGAATVQEASLSMSSDDGDYIGQGQTYSYATGSGDTFGASTSANTVEASVTASNGDWWYLNFAAPSGESLAVGTYAGATRYAFRDPSTPGLDVFGNGRGCNTLTGSFTVTQVTLAAGGSVESLDVDFEQHCEGAAPALRGHLHLVVAPPPPPLAIGLALADSGSVHRVSGSATVRGTVTCNRPTTLFLSGRLEQRATRFAQASGSVSVAVECDGTTPWETRVSPSNNVPFGPGPAHLSVSTSAFDPETGRWVSDSASATVKLGR